MHGCGKNMGCAGDTYINKVNSMASIEMVKDWLRANAAENMSVIIESLSLPTRQVLMGGV
jgi:hypothetical protein